MSRRASLARHSIAPQTSKERKRNGNLWCVVAADDLSSKDPESDQRAHRFRAEVESNASAVTPLSTQAATAAMNVRRISRDTISRDTISACHACSAAEAPTGAAAYAAGAAAAAAGAIGTALGQAPSVALGTALGTALGSLCKAASTPATISAFISDAKVSWRSMLIS